jgi:hypothetical protein
VLADEDLEQDPDRWVSHTPCGQEFWQILCQWIWNLRLELGQHVSATSMRLTELSYSQIEESVQDGRSAQGEKVVQDGKSAQGEESVQGGKSAQGEESVQGGKSAQGKESVCYGPPQWARRSYTKGFAGTDFALQADGTLLCPANRPLYPQERRLERNGALRVLYAARIGHCRGCPLRAQCQENSTTIKPRRVSAVFWPLVSATASSAEPAPDELASAEPAPDELASAEPAPDELASAEPAPDELASAEPVPSCPVLWGDWERCQIRRQWFHLLRTQTVLFAFGPLEHVVQKALPHPDVQTRAQRAHWRLSWKQRLARNARPPHAPPLEVTVHGLPVCFAQSFGFDVVPAA